MYLNIVCIFLSSSTCGIRFVACYFDGENERNYLVYFCTFQLISHGELCLSPIPSFSSSYWRLTASFQSHNPPYSLLSPVLVRGELILTLLLNVSVSLPEPTFLPENFKKKDVVEILSHKKAYNACEYE